MIDKLNKLTDKKDRINLIILFLCLLISTIFEMVGLGSIPIFAMAVIQPDTIIEKLPNFLDLNFLYELSYQELVVYMSILIITIFLIKNLFLVFLNYFSGHIVRRIRQNLTNKMFKNYINSDYDFHIERNSADLIRNVYSEVSKAVYLIVGFISLVKEILILIMILALLVFASTSTALLIFGFLGLFSFLFFLYTRNSSKLRGKIIQEYWGKQTRTLKDGMSSIKEIKILNKEKFIYNIFHFNTKIIEKYNFIQSFIVTLPRLFLEVITIFGVAIFSVSFVLSDKPIETFVPIIVLISVSAIRLIPSFSTISQSFATIKYQTPAFELILKELDDMKKLNNGGLNLDKNSKKILFRKEILLNNVSFSYPSSQNKILNKVNLEIKHGDIIGLAGRSGEGKSTLVDLICGLLKPSEGEILVDGVDINKDSNNWRTQLGYVPQEIFFLDESIKSNIAFGIDNEKIDKDKLEKSLKISQLFDFVQSLPKKENTNVGEQGVKLSGGQKQRIGIARALYFSPEILILDEPTSALDAENEKLILEDIYNLGSNITLIIISHRENVFKRCNKIFKLNKGNISQDS